MEKILTIIKDTFKDRDYGYTFDGEFGIKIEIAPLLDFDENYKSIVTNILLIKPQFGIIPKLDIRVFQHKESEFSVK